MTFCYISGWFCGWVVQNAVPNQQWCLKKNIVCSAVQARFMHSEKNQCVVQRTTNCSFRWGCKILMESFLFERWMVTWVSLVFFLSSCVFFGRIVKISILCKWAKCSTIEADKSWVLLHSSTLLVTQDYPKCYQTWWFTVLTYNFVQSRKRTTLLPYRSLHCMLCLSFACSHWIVLFSDLWSQGQHSFWGKLEKLGRGE